MNKKKLPFTKAQIEKIIKKYPTPFHIYDEKAMRENAREFQKSFEGLPGFKNYYAVKACPNPYILKILKEEGMGVDCSSLMELSLAGKVGFKGEEIMFTSNDTSAQEFKEARRLNATINLDDISHIEYLEKNAGLPELLCFRYQPKKIRGGGNVIIGKPTEAKYGLTREQLFEAYAIVAKKGVKRFGLHAMVVSNELDPLGFVETADMLFDLVVEIHEKLGIKFEFINLGGGVGVPYKPDQEVVDLKFVAREIKKLYEQKILGKKISPLRIVMECGRAITGPFGYLVSRVIHLKSTYKDYVGLDASMANFMRPAMYGAYHHISILGKEKKLRNHLYDVTGSLCENNDKFAIGRKLPNVEIGDLFVIHDTGAHGHAMGFNYNGKLRSAELLLRPDRNVKLIRRAETADDYFATLDFSSF